MKRTLVVAIAGLLLLCTGTVAARQSWEAGQQLVRPSKVGVGYPHVQVSSPHGKRKSSLVPQGSPPAPVSNVGFFAAHALAAGGQGYSGALIGDYNGDGKSDVASVVSPDFGATYSLSVLLGNGDTTFAAAILTTISFATTDRIYTADLNHDNNDDIVLVHSGSLDVFMSNGDGTFSAPANYADGLGNPVAALLSDINGDGKIDFTVTDGLIQPGGPGAPQVSTLIGNGDGTFQAFQQASLSGQARGAVFADVNHDTRLDVISTSLVMLADSSGGFLAGVALVASNGQPNGCEASDGAVAVADLNGDGFSDIATADCAHNTVTVFLNNGSGAFQPGVSYPAGNYPRGVAVADMNGDGSPDIVAANANSADVTVLLGNGAGTFQAPRFGYSAGGYAWASPAVADFDGDGKADVIVASQTPDSFSNLIYLQGFGDGSFAAGSDYWTPAGAPGSFAYGVGIASADFNGDGRLDFVSGNAGTSGFGITVFLANSSGTLQPGVNYGTSGTLSYVATGDFNGDGKQDIVAADSATDKINLFLGNGNGTFQAAKLFAATVGTLGALVVADFNQDHKPDVAVVASPSTVVVLLNNGTGGFQAAATYPITSDGATIAVADLNGDGLPDLAVPQYNSSLVSILIGSSNGTFQSLADVDLGSRTPAGIAVGDLNGDSKADLAVTIDDPINGMGVAVALGDGDGTFQPATVYPTTETTGSDALPTGIQLADVDGDGKLDAVYDNSGLGTVGILFGKGDGTFDAPVEIPGAGYPYQLLVADANGDGVADVVAVDHTSPGIVVLLNVRGSTTVLSSSSNPAALGDSVTLTAAVAASAHGISASPTGTVVFSEGATILGTVLLSGGQASVTVANLSIGSHTFTASYSGDASFVSSIGTLVQVVTSGPNADFSLSVTPTKVTIGPGKSSDFTVTVTPAEGYDGTVSLSCGATVPGISCQFAPSSLSPASGPVQAQLTVSAAASLASASIMPHRSLAPWTGLGAGLFGFVLLGGMGSRRRWALVVASLVIIAAMLVLSGCGLSSGPGSTDPVVHSYNVPVIATGTAGSGGGGVITHQVNLVVKVTQ